MSESPRAGWVPEPSSVVDPVGRVFHREGRVFRGIRPAFVHQVRELVALAGRERWFDRGLVETALTSETIDGYPLVIEHQRMPFVTYRGEWPAESLRAAARCYVALTRAMVASGHALKDAHPWNVLFEDTTPRVVDFGSIRPIGEIDWDTWRQEFTTYFLAPLLLFAAGESVLARALTREHVKGVGTWLLGQRREALLPRGACLDEVPSGNPERILDTLARCIDNLSFPHRQGEWTAYPQPRLEDMPAMRLKDRIVEETLQRLRPPTLLDLGANRGLHSRLAASTGARVLAADIDEACLDDVYTRAAEANASVHPVYLDVAWPQGSGGAFDTMRSAPDRLRCDTVLVMALMHHVCVRQQFAPAAFVGAVAAYSARALLLEFAPAEDLHVAQWTEKPPAGYRADAVRDALLTKFDRVECVVSDPAPRVVFVCEGRRP